MSEIQELEAAAKRMAMTFCPRCSSPGFPWWHHSPFEKCDGEKRNA